MTVLHKLYLLRWEFYSSVDLKGKDEQRKIPIRIELTSILIHSDILGKCLDVKSTGLKVKGNELQVVFKMLLSPNLGR